VRIAQICRPLAESDVVVGLDFGNREKQHLEIGVTGVARSSVGNRGAASRRSAGSSRLFGAHNSAIGDGHRHAVDAATAIVAKA